MERNELFLVPLSRVAIREFLREADRLATAEHNTELIAKIPFIFSQKYRSKKSLQELQLFPFVSHKADP